MNLRVPWRIWVGIFVSGLLLWLVFRGVDWSSLGRAFMMVSWLSCGLTVLFLLANLVVRALRWRVLLTSLRPLPFVDVFAHFQIGYLANNLLPLRAGELVRVALLGQKHALSKSAVLATVAVERVLDVLSLIVLAVVLTFLMDMPQAVRRGILVTEVLAIAAVVGLWVLSTQGQRVERWLNPIITFIPLALQGRVTHMLTAFIQGLQTLRSGGQMLLAMSLSLTAWGFVLCGLLFIFRGFGLALPWYAGVFVIVVLNLGILIPSSPGSIGVAHFLIVFALSAFAVNKTDALSVALVTHGLNSILNIVLGFIFLWRENIALGQLSRLGQTP